MAELPTSCDIAVIGAGPAGQAIAAAAAPLGANTLLIDDRFGETMADAAARLALLATARAALAARVAPQLGLGAAAPHWDAVCRHVAAVRAEALRLAGPGRLTALGVTVRHGMASFASPSTLRLDGSVVTARRIVIATGRRSLPCDLPGMADAAPLDLAGLLALRTPPARLLVLGGDARGAELAQCTAALGWATTLVAPFGLLPDHDAELVDGVRRALRHTGVLLYENRAVQAAESGPTLLLADGTRLTGSHLLVVPQEEPALSGLDLDRGGVRWDADGIATRRDLRNPANRRVFAAGSVAHPVGCGPRHGNAEFHAAVVLRAALFRLPARLPAVVPPILVATVPALAQIGLTETQARAAGLDIRVLRAPVGDTPHARAAHRPEGLVKLVVSPRGRLLGAGILADQAGEMIAPWSLAMARGIPLSSMGSLPLPPGTAGEAARNAAAGLAAATLVGPRMRRLVGWLARLP